jgi:hypothetical protein
MESEGGDGTSASGPFKEGTIKFACYNVLKNTGARGLSVRLPFVCLPRPPLFLHTAKRKCQLHSKMPPIKKC